LAGALISLAAAITGCQSEKPQNLQSQTTTLGERFGDRKPTQWSETVPGVMRYLDLPASQKTAALTLDACGSNHDGYDKALIDFLIAEKIPATLFLNLRWIEKNPYLFDALSRNPLFDIQNHGQRHLPASVNGKSIYNLPGTTSVSDLIQEVDGCSREIRTRTGVMPNYYRSGTAYYDEVAVEVINAMGLRVAGFSVLGDAGCSYSAAQVKEAVSQAQPNDIIIAHMNHPEKQTAEGLIPALKALRAKGLRFVTLRNTPTRHTPPKGYVPTKRDLAVDINTVK